MKKVLFVATISNHIIGFHTKFLKLFKKNGYETHVAVGDNSAITNYCDKSYSINICRSPYKIENLKGIKQLKRIIKNERFDIIHCHTPMGGAIARLAAKNARKKYGTRVIYTCHGFHFYKGSSLKNWFIYYPVEWYLARYTDTLITINTEDYNLAKKHFLKRCKDIQYVPGVGVDVDKFNFNMNKKEINEYREKIGLNKKDFIMIFPARLDKNKNQILLIEVVEQLLAEYSNIHLLLPGRDELNGYYQRIVQKKKLGKNIHFLGYRTDIASLIKISDIAVSSSLREGLGLNVIEAIYCGVPVVALNNRGHRDIINSTNGFLVNNKQEFMDKIRFIYKNKNKNYNVNNMRETIKKFQYNEVINQMQKIYNLKRK